MVALFLAAAGFRPRAAFPVVLRIGVAPRPALLVVLAEAFFCSATDAVSPSSSSDSESACSWKVTVFFLAGPRRIFDRMVVDLVAMRICLVRAFSATASGSGTVRVFLRVAVVFDVVDPFGRPRGFGPVSVLAAVDVSFFLGLPTRFFTGSGLEASFSPPSLPSLSAGLWQSWRGCHFLATGGGGCSRC